MGLPFVSIVGTTECDAHCEFCDRWREPIITMDPELTCRLIEQLPDQRTAIDITGGQPGLWNGISLVLNQCRKKHLPTTVTVSGPTAMNLIEDIPLISYLRVSVHGTPEHHDRFQGNGFYQANLEFLQAVMKHKQPHRPPELIFTVRKEQTAEDFWTVDQIARQLGVRVIGNFDWGLKISPKIFQLVDTFRRRPYWVFSLAKIRYWLRGGNNILHPTCAANQMMVLHGDSIVQPCMEFRHSLPAIPLDYNSQIIDILRSPERLSGTE